MYTIEATTYGFRITQKGLFTIDTVEQYKSDLIRILSRYNQPFSLLIDSREIVLPTPDIMEVFNQLHKIVWHMSCIRTAIVVESPLARDMVIQACAAATICNNDRIIDARKYPDWEQRALAWIEDAVEPDSPAVADECDIPSGELK